MKGSPLSLFAVNWGQSVIRWEGHRSCLRLAMRVWEGPRACPHCSPEWGVRPNQVWTVVLTRLHPSFFGNLRLGSVGPCKSLGWVGLEVGRTLSQGPIFHWGTTAVGVGRGGKVFKEEGPWGTNYRPCRRRPPVLWGIATALPPDHFCLMKTACSLNMLCPFAVSDSFKLIWRLIYKGKTSKVLKDRATKYPFRPLLCVCS